MTAVEAMNMRLLAHHDLNGFGNGGEGLALQETRDGRRVLYIAHESGPERPISKPPIRWTGSATR